jgi:Zn-dependent protease
MNNINLLEIGAKFFIYFIPFLFALSFHEFAHGWVARLKGDRTAEFAGRLTMNPLAHIDPLGTVVLPMLAIVTGFPFFGWAKPVPVNERNLRNPQKDMFWVALAGPLSNILLAFVGTILLVVIFKIGLSEENTTAGLEFLRAFIYINLFLAFFNLLPVYPLDGAKVFARFLPYKINRFLEENQSTLSFGLMAFFLLGGFRILAGPVNLAAGLLLNAAAQLI